MTAETPATATTTTRMAFAVARARVDRAGPAAGAVGGDDGLLAVNHLVTVRESRGWVAHSRDVIETTQALFSDVQDVESGTRGYLLSNDPRYLDQLSSRSDRRAAARHGRG